MKKGVAVSMAAAMALSAAMMMTSVPVYAGDPLEIEFFQQKG